MSKWFTISPQYKRLLAYTRPYRGRMVAGIACSVLYGPTNGLVLSVVKKVWASAFESDWKYTKLQVLGFALLLPLTMLARGVSDFFSNYLMNWVGLRSVTDLRVRVFEHLQSFSLDFYTESRTGEVISRVTNDVGLVQQSISSVVEDIIKQPVTLLSVLVWLVYTDWRFTVAALGLFPLCLIPILVFGRKTRKASKGAQESQASLVSVLQEAIIGFRVVKAFGMEKREVEEFVRWSMQFFRQRMRVIRARAISGPMIELVAGVGVAIAFIYAYNIRMLGSQLVSMCIGLFMLYEPVKKISRIHLCIQESLSGADRVFQLLDTKPTIIETPHAIVLPRLRQSIRYEGVVFHYGDNGAVLDNVDLEIPVGSVVALVGASGAGKTTMFNLLPRFYDPSSGAVKIDGQDIRNGTIKSLRNQIGLVTQETFLFNDTVANNIAYSKEGASREEIVDAAKRAHAHEFIEQMPQQYDTIVGESGIKLSGGQRQRLAIARAILKNPPILLLDEATNALDTESERIVQSTLDDLMWGSGQKKQHTMLVIAHRLSTVQHADCIIVMDKGRIAEKGTHDELMARKQIYRRLYDLQFKV